VVVAPERHDADGIGSAYLPRDLIAADPGARDHSTALHHPGARVDLHVAGVRADRENFAAQADLGTGSDEAGRKGLGYDAKVDDGRAWRVERRDAPHVRLALADARLIEEHHAVDPVRRRAAPKLVKSRQLLLFD